MATHRPGCLFAALAGLALAGCRGLIEIPPQPPAVVAAPAGGAEVVQAGGGTEIIEPPATADERAWCFARAQLYRGMAPVRCADLARLIRP
jgi:hypothetical protein